MAPKKKRKPPLGSGERFASLTASLAAKGVSNPKGAAAAIGRAKYGNKRMSSMAARGAKRAAKK